MIYESKDPNCKGEQIRLAHCGDCSYTGNKGKWKGTKTINKKKESLEGIVELLMDDTWDLNNIITPEENEKIGETTGEAYCPICGSPNFY